MIISIYIEYGVQRLRIGKAEYAMELSQQPLPDRPSGDGQWLLLAGDQGPLAWFGLNDRLRTDAAELIGGLKQRGLDVVLLSGDHQSVVDRVAAELQIEQAIGNASPDDKLAYVQQRQRAGEKVLMMGDGVNDVPVLASADISIAMGNASDLAKTSADAVLLGSRLGALLQAISIAKRTRAIMIENLGWATLYNVAVLPLAALGMITPALAALGMSVSSLLVVLNALRLTRIRQPAQAALPVAQPEPST